MLLDRFAQSSPWLGILAAIIVLYWILYPYVFSPLRHIPGPWYAIYTRWWMAYKTVQGVRAKTIHDLHLRYGPWVRIAPNEVSTCDPDAIIPIYGVTSKFTKTEFYTYQLRAVPELFTMADQKQHAQRRRQLSHIFAMSTIKEYEPIVADNVQLCMDLIAEQSRGTDGPSKGKSNLYDWFHYLSMDIICELSFGMTFNMLREGANSTYIQDMYGSLEIEPVRWHFGWLNKYAAWAPLKFIRDAEACSVRSMQKGVRMVRDYRVNSQDPSKRKRGKDMLQKMLAAKDEVGQPLSEDALNVEATGLILAGSHTTSSSLTWIVWRLLRNPSILAKLNKELDQSLGTAGANISHRTVPSHAFLEPLPYLNAVIKEGLRIDTAVPGSTPRYVPQGGSAISSSSMKASTYLPDHTIISAQAYTCHRDPTVFPDPEIFSPERWLDGKETAEMRRLYIPFGADGPRKCIGIHLAYMELRVILAALLWRFNLDLVDSGIKGRVDEDMEMHELWLAAPKGQRLDVVAHERL